MPTAPEPTSETPARIRISFENRSEREQTVGCGPLFAFSDVWCEDCHLVLIPTDRSIRTHAFGTTDPIIPAQPPDGCWQTDLVHTVRNDVLRWQSIAGGETIGTASAVLHYPEEAIMDAVMDTW
jgi:hypothetical protein